MQAALVGVLPRPRFLARFGLALRGISLKVAEGRFTLEPETRISWSMFDAQKGGVEANRDFAIHDETPLSRQVPAHSMWPLAEDDDSAE